jgi:hypothetical protein
MQRHENMICEICGKENENKHQDYCVDLGCSGRMISLKAQTDPVAEVPCSGGVIKPCPFCGGPGKTYTWDVKEHLVFCGNEDCETRPQTKVKINDREAIEVWNRRAL